MLYRKNRDKVVLPNVNFTVLYPTEKLKYLMNLTFKGKYPIPQKPVSLHLCNQAYLL